MDVRRELGGDDASKRRVVRREVSDPEPAEALNRAPSVLSEGRRSETDEDEGADWNGSCETHRKPHRTLAVLCGAKPVPPAEARFTLKRRVIAVRPRRTVSCDQD